MRKPNIMNILLDELTDLIAGIILSPFVLWGKVYRPLKKLFTE